MVRGYERFARHFADFADQFIIIGGTAVQLIRGDDAPHPRTTRDIDLLIVSEKMSHEFAAAFHAFLSAGGYRCYISREGHPRFYRFLAPRGGDYPEMIELLSSSPFAGDSGFMPLQDVPSASMSAIVLDREYYECARANRVLENGMPCLSREALVVFKTAAYLNLLEEYRQTGDPLRLHDTKKHRRDVFTLVREAPPNVSMDVTASIRARLHDFIEIFPAGSPEWPGILMAIGADPFGNPQPLIDGFRRMFNL